MRTKNRTSTGVGVILALLISLTGVPALAQTTTATLSGTVRDGSGAVVNGATVTLVNSATGRSRSTRTDDEGRYSLSHLEPGVYELRAQQSGFKTVVQRDLILTVG